MAPTHSEPLAAVRPECPVRPKKFGRPTAKADRQPGVNTPRAVRIVAEGHPLRWLVIHVRHGATTVAFCVLRDARAIR
jgi:hypothetical protein